jgi:hypothetical protein
MHEATRGAVMINSEYQKVCQAFDYLRNDALDSVTFLRFAILPYLTLTEQAIIMGIWDRTSRFGAADPVPMTYEDLIRGKTPYAKLKFLIPAPAVGRSQFYESVNKLKQMGLIKQEKRGFSITCYPYDYVCSEKELKKALLSDKKRGQAIMSAIMEATIHYASKYEILLDRAALRGFIAKEKNENR